MSKVIMSLVDKLMSVWAMQIRAQAIEGERERCALIAEKWCSGTCSGKMIAQRIRDKTNRLDQD